MNAQSYNGPVPFDTRSEYTRHKRAYELRDLVERKLRLTLNGKTQKRSVIDARKIFVYLCREANAFYSYSFIASIIGKDHVSCLRYYRCFIEHFETNKEFREKVQAILTEDEYLDVSEGIKILS